ncbi:hypothetical protein NJL88_11570 [Streptomyces sp. DK15]|uniref:hypothetical protein n=1 Tax=Streptomyces sp. DK15 TaxID=2957499 RepID=UPI0029A3BB70|nr:hypothetical protein [Streptomyces sp. DK15]MDX2390692.1 hypothetical protein [Streptomyces sp. DK15]
MLPLEGYVALYDDPEEPYTQPVFALAAYGAEVAPVVRSNGSVVLAGVKGSDPAYGAFLGLFTPAEASNVTTDIALNREEAEDAEHEGAGDGERDS